MKITVADCLNMDAFKSCVVAAGKSGLDNIVRSLSVLDAADLATALANNGVRGQMVLTSFYAMQGNIPLQMDVLRGLSKKEVAAVVVFHGGNSFLTGKNPLIRIAEEEHLPLLLMPEDAHGLYAPVMEEVMGRMLREDDGHSNLINNTIYHIMDFDKHKGFRAALREAALKNDFQVALISKDFNPVLVIETRYRTTIAEAVKLMKRGPIHEDKLTFSFVDMNGVMGYWGSIDIAGEKYFLLLVDNEDCYSATEMTKLAEIIEIAIGMWKYTPKRDLKTELIKALIRDNKSLAYSLKDEMNIPAEGIVSVFYTKGLDMRPDTPAMENFEKQTKAEILRLQEGDESYGILVMEDTSPKRESEETAAVLALYDRLKESGKGVRIFQVTGLDGIEGAGDAFRLIGETWTFVESVFPYKRVFSKYEMVLVSTCIGIQVRSGMQKKNYSELLEPFRREMGEKKANQLLDTLETFVLDAGMNSAKTAKFMGVHANTVQYRLKRINEVLGAEITGNRVIPGLTIALALKRLERAVK